MGIDFTLYKGIGVVMTTEDFNKIISKILDNLKKKKPNQDYSDWSEVLDTSDNNEKNDDECIVCIQQDGAENGCYFIYDYKETKSLIDQRVSSDLNKDGIYGGAREPLAIKLEDEDYDEDCRYRNVFCNKLKNYNHPVLTELANIFSESKNFSKWLFSTYS